MPERATTEFWKDLKPIANVFKPDALREHFIGNAPTEDKRYYVPFNPTRIFFVVQGPLIWVDEEGAATGYFDVHDYIALCEAHYEKVGIGKGFLRSLFR
jgi:hypothetical protein